MVVHQCPCGALACRRRPRGARPRSRVRLVFAPDSSRKTSRVGSKPPCRRRQARRARAISGRSCSLARSVFFYISAPSSGARSGWRARSKPKPRRGAARPGSDRAVAPRAHATGGDALPRSGASRPEKRCRAARSPVRRRCCRSFFTIPSETPKRSATPSRVPSPAS